MNTRRLVLFGVFALAEAALIAPPLHALPTFLRGVNQPTAPGLVWLALCGVSATRRLADWYGVETGQQRALMGVWLAGLVIAFVAAAPPQPYTGLPAAVALFLQAGCALLVWWRGVRLADAEFMPNEAQQRLQVGLLVYAGYALISVLDPSVNLLPFVLLFVFSALLALPLTFLERVEQSDAGRRVPMTARWWRSTLVTTGLGLLAGATVILVLTPDLLRQALSTLILVILFPFIVLAGYLLEALIAWLGPLLKREPQGQPAMEGLNALRQQIEQQAQSGDAAPLLNDETTLILSVIALVIVLLIVLVTTVRARRNAELSRARPVEDDLTREAGQPDAASQGPANSFNWRRWLATLSVRRIYARLVYEAGRRGFKRLPAQTPYDYLPDLQRAFPGAVADLRLITDAYVSVHYGEAPETDAELAAIRQAWERVRVIRRSRHVSTDANADLPPIDSRPAGG